LARSVRLPRPDDFHLHLRQGEALGAYARREALSFGRALVMPNTVPPIASAASIEAYRASILSALESGGSLGTSSGFEPLMTFKLLPGMSRETVFECAASGAVAGKYYPAGVTTNSSDGLADPAQASEALAAMEEAGLVLCIHGENPAAPVLAREEAFLPTVERILARYPRLRIVLEHISTRASLDFVRGIDRGDAAPAHLSATVTAHHLLCTLDDLMGEGFRPGLYCKPPLRSAADRDALREAVLGGDRRLFFGSDSAPHTAAAKRSAKAPAGIYSSPVALPALVQLFDEAGRLDALSGFIAERGAAFYGLPAPRGEVELVEEDWKVPEEIDGALAFLGGATLRWRLQ
jgi:dihydroorotase